MAYQQTTLAELRTALAHRWDAHPFWTPGEATTALNEAVRCFGTATGFFREQASVVGGPNLPYLTLPAPLAIGARVRYAGFTLLPASLFDLDEGLGPTWEDARGTPRFWVPIGPLLIAITPVPTIEYVLVVDGLIAIPQMVADDDFLALGDEEQSAILDYALHKCLVKMGPSFMKESSIALDRFRRACALRNAQLLKAHLFRAATGRAELWLNPFRNGPPDDRPAAAE